MDFIQMISLENVFLVKTLVKHAPQLSTVSTALIQVIKTLIINAKNVSIIVFLVWMEIHATSANLCLSSIL